MSLLLIPAIDLKDGQCVRLRQGDLQDATIFSDHPGQMAARWIGQGARRIHVVDLNGSVAGRPKNEAAVRAIIEAAGPDVPVQIGGGIRDLETIERYLDDGASFVVIGTAAVKNPGLLKDACAAFPGQIIVSIDAKDGKVATDGWSKLSGHEVIDLAQKFENDGVSAILYTDIGRDGMLSGVNVEATVRLAQAVNIPILASGGIAGMADIRALCEVESEGVMGAILGRALYEGQLDLGQAQAYADEQG
jgi:phosphoribosylformimino-5-aminoimidazole carboxamide ribotide isomerase